jgi:hypothetical protein
MKILFFNPEQYVDFSDEPSNYQLRLPILNCGLPIEHRDHAYQRDLRSDGVQAMNERAFAAAREFQPDLVVYSSTWPQENLDPRVLAEIRARGARVMYVAWDSSLIPDPHEIEFFMNCDSYVVYDSLAAYLRLRQFAASMALPVEVSFAVGQIYSDHFRPLPVDKIHDVAFLGSVEGARAGFLEYLGRELAQRGHNLVRTGGLVNQDGSKSWVDWSSYARIISESRICVSSQSQPHRRQIKGKIFDYMACGSLCLTDANPDTRLLVPSNVAVYYDNDRDCLDKCLHYLEQAEDRSRIVTAASAWLVQTFDYKRYWSTLINRIVHGTGEGPTLPVLETCFERMRAAQPSLIRTQLAAAGRLAEAILSGSDPQRLSVSLVGVKDRFRVLEIAGRWLVATDINCPDFLSLGTDDYLVAQSGSEVLMKVDTEIKIADGHVIIGTQLDPIVDSIVRILGTS